MKQIYRTVIRGHILESESLRQLLARAVEEKRVDLKSRAISCLEVAAPSRLGSASPAAPPVCAAEDTEG